MGFIQIQITTMKDSTRHQENSSVSVVELETDFAKIKLTRRAEIIDEGIDYSKKSRCSNCRSLLDYNEIFL